MEEVWEEFPRHLRIRIRIEQKQMEAKLRNPNPTEFSRALTAWEPLPNLTPDGEGYIVISDVETMAVRRRQTSQNSNLSNIKGQAFSLRAT